MSAVMNKHLFEHVPEISSAGGLEKIALHLLEKDPKHRPESADVIVQQIEALEANDELDGSMPPQMQDRQAGLDSTRNERGMGLAADKTAGADIDFAIGKPRMPSYFAWALAACVLIGGLFAFLSGSSDTSTERIQVAGHQQQRPARKEALAPSTKKPRKRKNVKPRRSRAKPKKRPSKTRRANKPAQKPSPANKAQAHTQKSEKPKGATPKPSTPTKPPKVPARKPRDDHKPEGETIVEVEVDIERPKKNPQIPSKTTETSVGSIAGAHRADSKKQPQNPTLLKKKLAELDRRSSGKKAKSNKEKAEEFKRKAIKAIADKRLVWAEIELGRCLDLDRKNSDCNKLMAVVRERKTDKLGAIKFYLLYLKYTPEAPDRQHVLGLIEKLKK
jgi:hypothetical protein